MYRTEFFYKLPQTLIAQQPAEQRTASRLLHLDAAGAVSDRAFADLVDLLRPGDLLVCNDTQVIKARLMGKKSTGGKVEILVERILDQSRCLVQLRASKTPKSGAILNFESGISAEVEGRSGDLFNIRFLDPRPVARILDDIGHVPLPPYIDRADTAQDSNRYQTVYAREPGAVAAPTAGLHFDESLMDQLRAIGVDIAFVTLHVGAGTFQPVRVENIETHQMHAEYLEVSAEVCKMVEQTRGMGGRVIAVGTTSVRALESASRDGKLQPFQGDTDIFIYPGYTFRSIDAMITNFHLPESTLLMLVCAFAGMAPVLTAYRYAVDQQYRFFSYGDAMFIEAPESK